MFGLGRAFAQGFQIRLGNGIEEFLSVGFLGVAIEFFRRGGLHDAASLHDGDVIGDELDHGKVVGDEEVGEVAPFLQLAEGG